MTRKKTLPAKADAPPPAATASRDEARQFKIAQALIRPSTLAAATIKELDIVGSQTDVVSLTMALREQQALTAKGDMSRAEAMLIAQATTLDALFCSLTRRAVNQELLHQYETHFRLALRAQSQCRATLETLALLKNPPNPTFIRQANVAHGPQQVNNATDTHAHAHARAQETENRQTELLGRDNGEWLDTRAAGTASGADPAMATLGTVDGTKVRRR